ncbi:MAG: BMP family ABC transporter substrate-binding protein [Christensenellales bacterium]
MYKKLSILIAIVMLFNIVLTGCASNSSSEPNKDAVNESPDGTKKLKIGSMFNNPDPANSGGWDISQWAGMKAMEKDYGWEVSIAENVPYPKVNETVMSYIDKDYDIVIFPDNGMIESWAELFPKYPDTYFIMVSSTATMPEGAKNTTIYQADQYSYGCLLGIALSKVTKTKKIGLLGGTPIPSVKYQFSGVIEACKAIDPEIEVLTYFAGDWSDTAKHREITQIMINQGVDAIFTMTGVADKGVYEAAESGGAKVIGYASDMYKNSPNTIFTSLLFDFKTLYADMAKAVMDGTIEQKVYPLGVEYMKYADFRGSVSEEVEKDIIETAEKFKNGELVIEKVIHEDILK